MDFKFGKILFMIFIITMMFINITNAAPATAINPDHCDRLKKNNNYMRHIKLDEQAWINPCGLTEYNSAGKVNKSEIIAGIQYAIQTTNITLNNLRNVVREGDYLPYAHEYPELPVRINVTNRNQNKIFIDVHREMQKFLGLFQALKQHLHYTKEVCGTKTNFTSENITALFRDSKLILCETDTFLNQTRLGTIKFIEKKRMINILKTTTKHFSDSNLILKDIIIIKHKFQKYIGSYLNYVESLLKTNGENEILLKSLKNNRNKNKLKNLSKHNLSKEERLDRAHERELKRQFNKAKAEQRRNYQKQQRKQNIKTNSLENRLNLINDNNNSNNFYETPKDQSKLISPEQNLINY